MGTTMLHTTHKVKQGLITVVAVHGLRVIHFKCTQEELRFQVDKTKMYHGWTQKGARSHYRAHKRGF